jgi:hypothetical protein
LTTLRIACSKQTQTCLCISAFDRHQ